MNVEKDIYYMWKLLKQTNYKLKLFHLNVLYTVVHSMKKSSRRCGAVETQERNIDITMNTELHRRFIECICSHNYGFIEITLTATNKF